VAAGQRYPCRKNLKTMNTNKQEFLNRFSHELDMINQPSSLIDVDLIKSKSNEIDMRLKQIYVNNKAMDELFKQRIAADYEKLSVILSIGLDIENNYNGLRIYCRETHKEVAIYYEFKSHHYFGEYERKSITIYFYDNSGNNKIEGDTIEAIAPRLNERIMQMHNDMISAVNRRNNK